MRIAFVTRVFFLVFVGFACAGCGDSLTKIDARTDALLRERAELMGEDSVRPRTEYSPRQRLSRSDPAYGTPNTTNPGSSRLTFTVADETRDIEAQLALYATEQTGDDAEELTLIEAFRITQTYSREFRRAEEDYILAAIRLLIEQHRWGPRFFADTSTSISGAGDDGNFQHALGIVNSLRATQRLPYGGEVEARLVWNATEQLRRTASGRYRQSTDLVLSGNIPLLRGAGMAAREDLIQRERDLVYAARSFERFRRELLVDIASDYFNLIAQMKRIRNQEMQLQGLIGLETQTAALVDAGRRREFQKQLTRNEVLNAKSDLANFQETYRLQLDRFKTRIGVKLDDSIRIVDLMLSLVEPQATLEAATNAGLTYRLDLQNQRDQLADSRRQVEVVRNQLLPDLSLSGRILIPTDPADREGGFGLDPNELDYLAQMTLALPVDREIERLNLRSSIISLERAQRAYEQSRDNVTIESRAALRAVDLARFRLDLAEQQVDINELRLEEQRARAEEVDPQSVVDTQEQLNNARNARDQARSDLQIAILRYLLQTGQLRVGRDGWLEPPEGMPEVVEVMIIDDTSSSPDYPVEPNPDPTMNDGD
ncbi:MAG: TolC family protein [Phycisphaeraceae bacterium]|nr:TolC family protein [Phycisphaeraceae bacterium]MCW5764093.1 TolC family protein [Phycisphaeraceae bacterium]